VIRFASQRVLQVTAPEEDPMRATVLTLLLPLAACSDAAWTLEAWGEDFAEKGIPAEAFGDGCSVTFETAEVQVTEVDLVDRAGSKVNAAGAGAIDLAVGRDVIASGTATPGVYDAVHARVMAADGPAVTLAGTIQCPDGSVDFAWSFSEDTTYQCTPDALELSAGAEAIHEFTVHFDHFFVDTLVDSDEEPPLRASGLLTLDTDGDGMLSETELGSVAPHEIGLDVGSHTELATVADWMTFISTTLGHIDGETHCER
jgi:hypothetical protein